jgi:predicted DNA-binding WGR domain protein
MVAHYYDQLANSDKVYMACVRRDGNKWLVIGKWGRRGKNISAQVKLTTQDEFAAFTEQRSLFGAKLKEGYVSIDDPTYRNGLNLQSAGIRENLEPEADDELNETFKAERAERAKKPKPENKGIWNNTPSLEDSLVAVCLNNSGAEEKFDVGVEYVFEAHKDKSMIWVYDKFGAKGEYFRDRFEIKKGQ